MDRLVPRGPGTDARGPRLLAAEQPQAAARLQRITDRDDAYARLFTCSGPSHQAHRTHSRHTPPEEGQHIVLRPSPVRRRGALRLQPLALVLGDLQGLSQVVDELLRLREGRLEAGVLSLEGGRPRSAAARSASVARACVAARAS